MSDELVQFLRDRYEEGECVAREATAGPWRNAPTARHHATASGRTEEAVFAAPPDMGALAVATTGEASERRNLVNAEHIARHDPSRVLREIDADRVLLVQYERLKYDVMPDDMTGVFALEAVIRAKAAVYADRPGYREEWRP